MASSRLFTLLGPSILRSSRNVSPMLSLKFNTFCLLPPRPFKQFSSSALTFDSGDSILTTDDSSAVSGHPWPEWVNFIDRLKAKGYFAQNAAVLENGGTDEEGVVVYTEMKLVKEACLSFGRDRFDIFKSLSRQDIQTIVEKGCPSLFRKAVNSAKRLRAYLGLDEGDVCGSCDLRGSCDRAYIMLNDSEAAARTVDVVRIILLYALDPLLISGENKLPGKVLVESSARKLLSELIELGDTPPDPDIPKRVAVTSQRRKQSVDLLDNKTSKNVDVKPGDWVCAKCNFMNFAKNIRCLKCKAEGPNRAPVDGVEKKKGDWDCPQCSYMNFASNRQCFRCQGPRPQRQLKPGDWECPSCDFMNFSRNTVCKRCNLDRPRESTFQTNEHTWRKPY
ncbi:hypothetical protein Sango_1718200 [Sesamum angolense]|uniref:RanBP2-type domain-containing protein n=1 Tax=Sesamum angolense TaxID=2727404 RepID=A0AAE1WLZ6_9LAMI|nr:hypothetical protein Sango_1718200 [Sesamum angolense]